MGTEIWGKVSAIDMSLEIPVRPRRGLKRCHTEMGFLEHFPSFTFDMVVIVRLSLINKPDEALHEAYCTLKKGGYLFVSDVIVRIRIPCR